MQEFFSFNFPLREFFFCTAMYKKYNMLIYTPPDLSTRFCKVNLSHTKNPASLLLDGVMQPINYNV